MGESVVIHENVKLPKATKLESNQIVIQTPTSYDLYQICARHVTDEEYGIFFKTIHFSLFLQSVAK